MAGSRPGGVTVVSILAWISGILGVITGILVVITPTAAANSAIMIAAWISIVLGLITIAVGVGLWRGAPIARILATIVFVLNLVNAVIAIFSGNNIWSAIVSALLAAIGIGLLWTKAASAFFRR